MAHPSVAIANAFIERADAQGKKLTNMQLQKLVYFAHGWMLAAFGERLTEEDPQAWDNGPVYRDLWEHMRNLGKRPVSKKLSPDDTNPFISLIKDHKPASPYEANLSVEEQQILDAVWERYGNYGAFKMSDMTHQPGTPWDQVYYNHGRNAPITSELIEEHYIKLGGTARDQSAQAG